MQFNFFVGIDVSKEFLDIAFIRKEDPGAIAHQRVTNNDPGIGRMIGWLGQQEGFLVGHALFCLEHTGMYNYPLLQFFSNHGASVWVENPVQIKKSLGLQRGKNDKVDAIRIASYAYRMVDQAKLWQPLREVTEKLKHLSALRERLVETKKKLCTPVEELSRMGSVAMAKMLHRSMSKTIRGLDRDLKAIEQQMKDIIDGDDDLKRLYVLTTSVVGIGFVTAVNLIVHTGEFKLFSSYRKFACYSGVAPFEHRSGSSIRGRTKVSHMANKKLKCNLHMASLSAVKLDQSVKSYYDRKVGEGKNKMSVLNAVRNKLLSRIFAVVERGTAYQKNYYQNPLVLS
jgi:transposase